MRRFFAGLQRIAIVSAIVIFCGATTCSVPVGDITYAKGYGYVVRVERRGGIDGMKDKNYYYIFPTEERAAEFYHQYYLDPEGFQGTLRPGERVVNDDRSPEEFDKITKLLQPLPPPPPLNDTEIPLGVPELPQPIPQTPQ